MFETELRPININEFKGSFCKYNEINLKVLLNVFEPTTFKLQSGEIKYLYITNSLKISCTYLSKKELKKLGLNQIKLLDGYWYFKKDLK